jgi:hypothetical protein
MVFAGETQTHTHALTSVYIGYLGILLIEHVEYA